MATCWGSLQTNKWCEARFWLGIAEELETHRQRCYHCGLDVHETVGVLVRQEEAWEHGCRYLARIKRGALQDDSEGMPVSFWKQSRLNSSLPHLGLSLSTARRRSPPSHNPLYSACIMLKLVPCLIHLCKFPGSLCYNQRVTCNQIARMKGGARFKTASPPLVLQRPHATPDINCNLQEA